MMMQGRHFKNSSSFSIFFPSVFEVGNFKAQDMLAMGTVSPESVPNTIDNGFFGVLFSVPQYFMATQIWSLVESYLGLTAGDLDEVLGYFAHSLGTARAMAFSSTIKVIDEPNGQGVRVQPKYRWGHETWFPLSVVPIVTNSFTNPSYPGSVVTPLVVIPAGSRA